MFLLEGYSRRASNYSERIILFDLTHMINIADLMVIYVETPRIDSGYSLEEKLIELIYMNPQIVLCLIVDWVDSFQTCVNGPLT